MVVWLLLSSLCVASPPPEFEPGANLPPPAPLQELPADQADDQPDPVPDMLAFGCPTLSAHAGASCGLALVALPLSCVPCVSWFLYPAAVAVGIDFVGRSLTRWRGNLLATGGAFMLAQGAASALLFGLPYSAWTVGGSVALLFAPSGLLALLSTPAGFVAAMALFTSVALGLLAVVYATATAAAVITWYATAERPGPADDRPAIGGHSSPRRRPAHLQAWSPRMAY